ncbi:DUF732 domain-containing protein [Geodermatophilus sp. SYSU D00867]
MRFFGAIVAIAFVMSVFDGCDDPTPDSGGGGDTSGNTDYSTDYDSDPSGNAGDPGYSDADVASLGHDICAAFDQGMSDREVESFFINSGLMASEADGVVYLAVNAYCPEYLPLVE